MSRLYWRVLAALLATALCFMSPIVASTVRLQRPTTASLLAKHSWRLQGGSSSVAAASSPASFQWLFPQRNLDWLQAELLSRSDPQHPHFLQWLTAQHIMQETGPTDVTREPVLQWLSEHGLKVHEQCRDYGDALRCHTDVDTVQRMFNTTLVVYEETRPAQGTLRRTIARSHSAHIPSTLRPCLHQLRGVFDFPLARVARTHLLPPPPVPAAPAAHAFHLLQQPSITWSPCAAGYNATAASHTVSPAFLASQYNISDRSNYTAPSLATAGCWGGFDDGTLQSMNPQDLAVYHTLTGYAAPFNATITNATLNALDSALNPGHSAGLEGTLDIQALFLFAPTSPQTFLVQGGNDQPYDFYSQLVAMSDATRPQVVSLSYAFGPSDDYFQQVDGGRSDVELQRLGLLGVTVLVASGDDGAPGPHNSACKLDTSSLYGVPISSTLGPMLPDPQATSAFVLAVGETDFTDDPALFDQSTTQPPLCNNCQTANGVQSAFFCQRQSGGERPVSISHSQFPGSQSTGGGLSNATPRPTWQQAAVSAYFSACQPGNVNNCTLPPAGYYHASGRGYPDISMFGGYFPVAFNGAETVVVGSSVSAPLLAGMVARLNELSLQLANRTLGFLPPLLYSIAQSTPAAFHDMTQGVNRCPRPLVAGGVCSTNCTGWSSAPGWDPVTGLGSPNYFVIAEYLTRLLQPAHASPSSSSSSSTSASTSLSSSPHSSSSSPSLSSSRVSSTSSSTAGGASSSPSPSSASSGSLSSSPSFTHSSTSSSASSSAVSSSSTTAPSTPSSPSAPSTSTAAASSSTSSVAASTGSAAVPGSFTSSPTSSESHSALSSTSSPSSSSSSTGRVATSSATTAQSVSGNGRPRAHDSLHGWTMVLGTLLTLVAALC